MKKLLWILPVSLITLLLIGWLLANTLIKNVLISELETVTGAEVNVDRVSLRLMPVSLQISGVQLTDPAKPAFNSLSFAKAYAKVDPWPALKGYYIVEELEITELAYGSARQQPGKVYRPPVANDNALDLASLLQVELPTAADIMARANLQTVQQGEKLKQLALTQQQQLQQLRQQLPDATKLAELQTNIKALTESRITDAADLAAKTQQFNALQQQVKAEWDQLRAMQQSLTQSRDSLTAAVQAVRQAAEQDWQQLQQLANIQEGGLAPIFQILLGDIWAKEIQKLEALYQLAKPYLQQAGEPAPAKPLDPNQPYPDFWVKNAKLHLLLAGTESTITMQDITTQHQLINNVATRFKLDVKGLPKLNTLQLNGDFAILDQMITNLSWQLEGMALEQVTLGGEQNALTLLAGLLSANGSLKLTDDQLKQQAKVLLKNANFAQTGNRYLDPLVNLLNQQSQIPFDVLAEGVISNPQVTVRSALDRMLGDALLGEAKQKIAQLQTQLRADLDSRLTEQLGAQQAWLSLLQQQESEGKAIEAQLESLLGAKMGNLQDQLKDRLLNRLGAG
ncbi:TIGR03545 family protein [Alishewanella sp. d11]|uniref:TIGR03545 family protein n=1 Tax=Alishewanella sp. d11 TaxID=3414030 RepID=UPI003BF8A67E